jgi:hypothetical protein
VAGSCGYSNELQIKVVHIYFISYVNPLYDKPFLRKIMIKIWTGCKVDVLLDWYEPESNSPDDLYCSSPVKQSKNKIHFALSDMKQVETHLLHSTFIFALMLWTHRNKPVSQQHCDNRVFTWNPLWIQNRAQLMFSSSIVCTQDDSDASRHKSLMGSCIESQQRM